MLRMFYNGFEVFLQVFQMHVSSVLSMFRCMLQVLHLDIFKVDRLLHLAPSSSSAVSPQCLHLLSALAGYPNQRRRRAPPPSVLLDAGGASWDGNMAGDRSPRVHAGTRSFYSITWGRDRCARFFCYALRSDDSYFSNRRARAMDTSSGRTSGR